jgi:hypothetical protein
MTLPLAEVASCEMSVGTVVGSIAGGVMSCTTTSNEADEPFPLPSLDVQSTDVDPIVKVEFDAGEQMTGLDPVIASVAVGSM